MFIAWLTCRFYKSREFLQEQYFISCSCARIVDKFHVKCPNVAVSNNSIITRLIACFHESGAVSERMRTGRPAMLTDDKLSYVTNVMLCSPSKSIGRLSSQAHISYKSAQKEMKKLKFCAYRI